MASARFRFDSPFSSKRLRFVGTVLCGCSSQWNIKMAVIAAPLNAGVIVVVTVWPQVYNLPHPPPSPVPNKPYGFCGRKAPWMKKNDADAEVGCTVNPLVVADRLAQLQCSRSTSFFSSSVFIIMCEGTPSSSTAPDWSPWYNRTGWLGVKHQVTCLPHTDSLTQLVSVSPSSLGVSSKMLRLIQSPYHNNRPCHLLFAIF